MTEYVPKKGDRVRVTLEGEVTAVGHQWFDIGDHTVATNTTATIEKLADYNPEPEWVNGDVILVSDGEGTKTPLIYCAVGEFAPPHQPVWSCASCYQGWHLPASVSEDWRNGDVEILYKADQQEAA